MTPSDSAESPDHGEQTTFSRPLLWFYAHCTIVGLAAGIGAMCWIALPEYSGTGTIAVICAVALVVSSVLAWTSLRRARNES